VPSHERNSGPALIDAIRDRVGFTPSRSSGTFGQKNNRETRRLKIADLHENPAPSAMGVGGVLGNPPRSSGSEFIFFAERAPLGKRTDAAEVSAMRVNIWVVSRLTVLPAGLVGPSSRHALHLRGEVAPNLSCLKTAEICAITAAHLHLDLFQGSPCPASAGLFIPTGQRWPLVSRSRRRGD
jgi:hypothetical protein